LDETDSLCPLLHLPNVRQVVLPGGHLLRFDADGLYHAVHSAMALAAHVQPVAIEPPTK
jgi:type IV secretory pathway VirJ component